MEESVLISTKKILGIGKEYAEFDTDIVTHINSVFSILNQLGVGPTDTFVIEDEKALWTDLELPVNQLSLVRTYLYLKVRMIFDPPQTSFVIAAVNQQIEEYETRLSYMREATIPISTPTDEGEDEDMSEAEELFALDWGSQGEMVQ